MLSRRLRRAVQRLRYQSYQISQMPRKILRILVQWMLRGLFVVSRPRFARAGFVLPTTVLLLLVVTLTVGSITLRTYSRTTQTIGERQDKVIYNAATPAIDRAKAKLEFLFDPSQNPRFPGGVPGEDQIFGMMSNVDGSLYEYRLNNGNDPYVLPDDPNTAFDDGETRIDINGDGTVDNAWRYQADTDGDGAVDAMVAYSIIFNTPNSDPDGDPNTNDGEPPLADTRDAAVDTRANLLQVRHAPLSNADPLGARCQVVSNNAIAIEDGWFSSANSTADLRKNFQVNVYVQPMDGQGNPDNTRPPSTIEFFQDREINRGNKWGAWFRNDLEIYPGPKFNWNGAMHTEGNLIVTSPRGVSDDDGFTAFAISAPESCLYTKDSSKITVSAKEEGPNNGNGGIVFEGQAIAGRIAPRANDRFESVFHLITNEQQPPPEDDGEVLDRGTDSINNVDIINLSLDPVQILTKDISESRGVANFAAVRDNAWQNSIFKQAERILLDESVDQPYLDDFYRADDRLGPKPRYRAFEVNPDDGAGLVIGRNIKGNADVPNTPDEDVQNELTDLTGSVDDPTNLGLDGYWERRARTEGMRLVVGQRLELGNLAGWGGVDQTGAAKPVAEEPLRPWETCTPNNAGRCSEARQRRTLRDNLAAVQATAVYHSANGDLDAPLACVATATHPGTAKTLRNSTTFENLNFGDPGTYLNTADFPLVISNFFLGMGTNGWEYEPPIADVTTNAEVMKALRNLAAYAGDPRGGSPSFEPFQDGYVHPYPSMAMWGDFSVLRRILFPGGSPNYVALSPADKTTLHTAACTLGMLAHNIRYLESYTVTSGDPILTQLNNRLGELIALSTGAFTSSPPPEAFLAGLEYLRDTAPLASPDDENALIAMARMLAMREQVERDRAFGFGTGSSNACVTGGVLDSGNLTRLCSDRPKFPILHSLFPLSNHVEVPNVTRDSVDSDTAEEPYQYIFTVVNTAPTEYQVVDLAQVELQPRALASWVLPHSTAQSGVTPNSNAANNPRSFIRECVTVVCSVDDATPDSLIPVAIKDASFFDGREMMTVRAIDLDLDLLKNTPIGGNSWLPRGGVVYAFREDAVREDSITRPITGAGPCDDDSVIRADVEGNTGACRMQVGNVTAIASTDPPLAPNKISPKSVDYHADPDRRAYGFRLRNGEQLGRVGDEGRGLSFITDNPVYIYGDFNLHQTVGCNNADGCSLEEFDEKLPTDRVYTFDEFYGDRVTLNTDFARRSTNPAELGPDLWRPSEILADTVSILSKDFCDGSIQDGLLTADENTGTSADITVANVGYNTDVYGCVDNEDRTSFLNQNRPSDDPNDDADVYGTTVLWQRENPFDPESPIAVTLNGNPIQADGTEYASTYFAFDEARPLTVASKTRINSIIISGIVPSRANQSYGGLHNFPRFLEDWPNEDDINEPMIMSGSFFQLNFSNAATAPFDQDAWEVGSAPIPGAGSGAINNFYGAPERLWGYDVGLQYAPASPIARRFTDPNALRSEFYSEPQADDPYISQLCAAIPGATCPN
ncbi:MAG: hormogonium polysaccharide biosynthesis protein HpsA [Elainellaceae cyanobacterium]